MYRVIQISEGKQPTLWCTTDDFDFLCKFCQFQIDSAYDGSLNDFWIVWTNGERTKQRQFYEFCDIQEIRKRTFEERMSDVQVLSADETAFHRD